MILSSIGAILMLASLKHPKFCISPICNKFTYDFKHELNYFCPFGKMKINEIAVCLSKTA